MLIKIGEAASKFELSNRTLRYWEEAGILSSIRLDNGYRYYDDVNLQRIRQIMMLRKLKLPIQDIQHIFLSNELSYAVGALQRHMENTRHEAEELKALSNVLEKLIDMVKSQSELSDVFKSLEAPGNSAVFELKNALRITLSERESNMSENSSYSKLGDVRFISLPRMLFASYRAEGTAPENECGEVMNKLILENSLHKKLGFRHFGFNNPDPQPGNPVYGYEMWAVVPEDFVVPEPFVRKEFPGGLFAAVPTNMSIIGERWKQLWDWALNNPKCEVDWNPDAGRRCLEECIDYAAFNSEEIDWTEKQLDLLVPVKLKTADK